MVANTKPRQRKKEGSERLRGERDKIGIMHRILDFEHSRNQRQGSEFSSPIGFNMGICTRKV